MEKLDKVQQDMLGRFGNPDQEIMESPLQKSHRLMVEDDNKLGHFICHLMNKMIQKGRDPTWDNFCGTPTWAVHGMNLSEPNRHKFAQKWAQIYKELKNS